MKNNSILKFSILVLGGLITLGLLKGIFFPTVYGMGLSANVGRSSMYMGGGAGYGFSIATIFTYLIRFFFVMFIVGLVGGLIVAAKKSIFTQEDIDNFKTAFSGKSNVSKEKCNQCGKEVNEGWKVCPHCGEGIVNRMN